MNTLRFFTLVLLSALSVAGIAADQHLSTDKYLSTDKHLGPDTCGNSSCHSAEQKWKVSAVTQREFVQWQLHDRHAKAWQTLKGDKAQRMARQLGIGPAHEATQCLACHDDNVPAEQRGPRFAIEQGVGCESCHGGAERWLGVHVSGTGGHAENVAAGMVPLDNPFVRAEVCSNCHVGSAQQAVTHTLYAAGHPRLAFELDSYTAAGANHYTVTDEYIKRKGRPDHARTWAAGQAVAAQRLLAGIASPARFHQGIQPELAFFDCSSCHHGLHEARWTPRSEWLATPGQPRLNDAHLRMLVIIAQRLAPAVAQTLEAQRVALHRASLQGEAQTRQAATALANTVDQLTDRLKGHDFRVSDSRSLLASLAGPTGRAAAQDYPGAEQLTLATSSLIAALAAIPATEGGSTATEQQALQAALDGLYAATNSIDHYQPDRFRRALDQLARAQPTTR